MKSLVAAVALILALSGSAVADGDLGRDWISMPEVMIRAYALGFTELSEIEAEHGVWKVKGFRNGVYTKVALDPRTGEFVPMPGKRDEH